MSAAGPPGAGGRPAPADELVDVLDDDGRVIGVATRAEMRARNLWHRSVFVAVLTAGGDLVVHRRADWKDGWPSWWDLCFGGVVGAGEPWAHAAARELAEEAGVVVTPDELTFLGAGRFEHARVRERYQLYLARSDGPFTFADGEVSAVERVPVGELAAWCGRHDVVPDSAAIVPPALAALTA